ncbi:MULTISPECIES: SURF1 family cytochrome oxidase biogenesis protein [Sphingomonas]|uniref:SURF1-like protein n=1 Tax=Sphingomonas molluscorum TaxID=418184 RepID=A0ABU8Q6E5_9SPHN|nr:surfeit locus 1 family protein [Sphingomonas sp. JUb134]
MKQRVARLALGTLIALVFAALVALGTWQLERRSWKLALIAQVEQRLHAPPVAAPGPGAWGAIDDGDVYTRVVASGRYRAGADSFVQASTQLGPGYWVLTPLDTGKFTLLVNRGFVPPELRGKVAAPEGQVSVEGLLRVTEPGGGFLRSNDPAQDRWYSRDVAAIANKRGLENVAPYFIDAVEPRSGWPRGGLTVVRFRNNHLGYAFTWFGLAAGLLVMVAVARRWGREVHEAPPHDA